MKEKKLVIICPSMWPDMNIWGETQRMYYLANHLAKQGWKITIISPRYRVERSCIEAREKNYEILYLGEPISRKIKKQNEKRNKQRLSRWIKQPVSNMLNGLGEWIYGESDIAEVLKKSIWIKQNEKAICQFIRSEEIEKVIISVPSFTFMELGKVIKKSCPDVKVFYDYRDPWYLWKKRKNPAYYRERDYLRYADWIIGFSKNFQKDMQKEMGIDPRKLFTVYNGYSEQDWEVYESTDRESIGVQSSDNTTKMVLTYTGSMSLNQKKNNYRNPAKLIEAVRSLPDTVLYLVGIAQSEEERVEGNIHYVREVTQQESFRYMTDSDVLISMHDAQDGSGDYLISGKFYDYMRSGKVILHIGRRNSLMAEWVRIYGLGSVCENQMDLLRIELIRLAELWRSGNLVRKADSRRDIEQYAREYQNEIYSRIINETM